ncbi:S4 domain-containing protein [uncultured Halopseudomonas sp.]|uniref:RNA-binding S4 domain-containing protein n=1 Tax=uncultured Halopseudomonas sp. TaxID=2901193 RepID=UPI0030ECA9DA|tara:strand:- start:2942 stop:3349 length:408 start_codon:yes stop_codon:yes gene_type:complete
MGDDSKVRLDKWLWAARFFKTRGLAKAAIEGGKVQCQGDRCKPSKEPKVGDQLQIRQGMEQRTVVILDLSGQRRGAAEAQLLYEETADSIRQREEAAAKRKAMGPGLLISEHRPTKKQRRQIHQFRNARNSPEEG